MSTPPAVAAVGLGKTYRIASTQHASTTAAEAVMRRLRRRRAGTSPTEELHALSDVCFELGQGEALGIVGSNGAGKSTLLKLLTRITAPTSGRIELAGRVGSLLEVGTGFHAELTGRENVYLNGTLLGMRRKEIRRRFDEIVAFAGVEKFLDTQVKRYSTGMYIRLAFAVAAHLETEILAVDEVLAVGDAEFQAKCLARMREVASDGRTVLYVSHQLQTVQNLCTRALYLANGKVAHFGTVDDTLAAYKNRSAKAAQPEIEASRRPGSGDLRFSEVYLDKDAYEAGAERTLRFTVEGNPRLSGKYFVLAHVVDAHGSIVYQCDSRLVGCWFDAATTTRGELRIRSPWMVPGPYTVDLYLIKTVWFDAWRGAASFDVLPIMPYPESTDPDGYSKGAVLADFSYEQT